MNSQDSALETLYFTKPEESKTEPVVAVERRPREERRAHVTIGERLIAITLCGDTVAAIYALLIAFWLRFRSPLRGIGVDSNPIFRDYLGYVVLGTLSLIAVLAHYQLYDRKLLLRSRNLIAKGALLWLIGFLSVSLLVKFSPPISRGYVMLAGALAIIFLYSWRLAFYRFLLRRKASVDLRQRVLLVGWNAEAERLTKSVAADAQSVYQIVGCVTAGLAGAGQNPASEIEKLGGIADVPALIEERLIDMVILADVACMKGDIMQLASFCEREMIQFKIIPSYFQILVSGLHLEQLNSLPVLGVSQLPLDRSTNVLVKRICDIAGALVGLVLAIPVILLAGALVWLESPGSIFYAQRRLGRRGLLFDIFKIRTMGIDAEKDNKPGWTIKDDPRRLKVGGFLRKWNIDELPQFWNVLRGDMSLVGPRPERPELISRFRDEIPHYNARHNVKPGMTGWAQVRGYRGDTDLAERISCDLYYLENWNLFLDFQIMLMTLLNNRGGC